MAPPYLETLAKRPFLPNFCVPDERDLSSASTGSNFNPPRVNHQNTPSIPACPVECAAYSSGVVKIFAFPRSKSGTFDLSLNKNEHFSKVSS